MKLRTLAHVIVYHKNSNIILLIIKMKNEKWGQPPFI